VSLINLVVLELGFFHFILLFDYWILRQKNVYTYSLDLNCGSLGLEIFFVCDLVSLYTYQTQSMLFFYFQNHDYFCFSSQNPKIFFNAFSPPFFCYDHIIDDFLLQFFHPFPYWF